MREIKFRGIHKIGGKSIWVEGFLSWDTYDGEKDYYISQPHTSYNVVNESVGQYTGLKDKNGKEIFESDIINFKANYCSIEKTTGWQNAKVVITEYQLELHNAKGEIYPANDETDEFPYTAEIIGNIYENPELITL